MPNRPLVVILGAGEPYSGTEPSALIQTSGDKRVLDWLLEAFSQTLTDPEFHFIGGYRMEEIIEEYPEIHFSQNEDWKTTGTVASLFTAPLQEGRPIYVVYADTIFEETAVEALNKNTAAAVDKAWETRYRSRTEESLDRAEKVVIEEGNIIDADKDIEIEEANAEFAGLLRLSPEALKRAKSLWNSRTLSNKANIPDLIRALGATGIEVNAVDIEGNWAELETAEDLSRFILDTKANTLRRLKSMVDESIILQQYTFTVQEWETSSEKVCESIKNRFDGSSVIIRSSALTEDCWEESNAGRFESVLDVPSDDRESLTDSIKKVINSYPNEDPLNQVLVQPMIEEVDQSGVVMTRTIQTGSPYYIINYDATTSSTESVTDGTGEHLRTTIVRKDIADNTDDFSDKMKNGRRVQHPNDLHLEPLLSAVKELEELIDHDSLDIEFAIDGDEQVYVLQTRPMTLDPAEETIDDDQIFQTIERSRKDFLDSQKSSPFIFGDRTIFGVMPDWNPAEIIGRQPKQLAASIYRFLVMDKIWARQRAEYGYRDVRPHPLMKNFAGQPYVDVRADFNSFIPDSVPDELAEQIVDYYINRLEENPEFHDKVEFDIVLTCLTFDYHDQIEPLLEASFTETELEPFRKGLQEITKEGYRRIHENVDMKKIHRLEERFEETMSMDISPLKRAYLLLEDCKRFGTLPFAHLARTAFVATSLLRSLERIGVISQEQRNAFQNSLSTVAREFEHDAYLVSEDQMEWDQFVEKYGHLRPGTYEITSPAYKQNPEEYLRPIVETASKPKEQLNPLKVWDDGTKKEIEKELEKIGLPPNADKFIEFLVQAIEGREHSKFIFSRNLSEAIESISKFGEKHDLNREELSHLSLQTIFELLFDQPSTEIDSFLKERVRKGREKYAITKSVELPPLLYDELDFLVFERPTREPNFVTNKSVTAEVVELKDKNVDPDDIDGKIVFIEQADPGYDWLFGHDINGLVTKYGGSNSHMAVRAAEFSLPAAIGIGENRYEQLRQSGVVELNCSSRNMRVIQ